MNKQLADKERIAAAMENPHLLSAINKCLVSSDKHSILDEALVSEQPPLDDTFDYF